MGKTVLVTGGSYGYGLLAARELALAGHTVYACVPERHHPRAAHIEKVANWAAQRGLDLRIIELNVQSDASVEAAIPRVIAESPCLDVIVHSSSEMAFGPAEAFTPEQLHQFFDVNVVGSQRVNRAVLPYLRRRGQGVLVWIGSIATHVGTPPLLGPYHAAKSAMDAMAVSYSTELARWGIETSIIMPGPYMKSMNRLADAGTAADTDRAADYLDGLYACVPDQVLTGLEAMENADSDPRAVGREIVRVIDLPFGTRPFRVQVGPCLAGTLESIAAAEKMRVEIHDVMGLSDLVSPAAQA